MNVLKEILGHASLSMTSDLYCHIYEDQKQKAMQMVRIMGL